MSHSPFNLTEQNQKIESKIVVALERISEAIRVLLWNKSKEFSLSPIQIQILIFIHFHTQEKCKVSYLANEFNMTKATISDSIRVLVAKELIYKEVDTHDTRSFALLLTAKGKKIVQKAALFTADLEAPIEQLAENEKNDMLNGLFKLIHQLNRSGVITIQRMCFSCSYYRNKKGRHHCHLLQTDLLGNELRLDCPDYKVND